MNNIIGTLAPYWHGIPTARATIASISPTATVGAREEASKKQNIYLDRMLLIDN